MKFIVEINDDRRIEEVVFDNREEAEEFAERAWMFVADIPHGSVEIIEEGTGMKYEKVFLVMNEQHSLLDDQVRALEDKFGEADIQKVLAPASGWSKAEMDDMIDVLYLQLVQAEPKFPHLDNPTANEYYDFTIGKKPTAIVFLSPIPYMVKELSKRAMQAEMGDSGCVYSQYDVFVFHNDNRAKKELDNGKIVYTVAKEGWVLV